MVQCELCDKWFRNNYDLKRHLERINPCNDTNSCQWCNKLFKRKDAKKKHQLICKEKGQESTVIDSSTCNVGINNGNINNGTTNNNVTINVLGRESLEHIPIEKIVEILRTIDKEYLETDYYLRAGKLVTLFDKLLREIPENQNVQVETLRSLTGKIHTQLGWESQPVMDIVDRALQNTAQRLEELTEQINQYNKRALTVDRNKRTWGVVGDLANSGLRRTDSLPGERRTVRLGFRVGLVRHKK